MIFLFPDLDTLRFALASGQVPTSIVVTPAETSFDDKGRYAVKPSGGIPPKGMQNALKRLGATTTDKHLADPTNFGNWFQIFPLIKEPREPDLTSQTPVLFELTVEQLPILVREMLRLGNDRDSFRMIQGPKPANPAEPTTSRVLLRVIGPPYYTLLRALDRTLDSPAQRGEVTAYLEASPSVWIQVGYSHPFREKLRVTEDQLLLMRAPRDWSFVEAGPFEDIYRILDFQLPHAKVDYQERELKGKLTVPLRLVPGNAAELPDLWIVSDDAINTLDAFVREVDETRMSRLSFAVAKNGDQEPTIIVRVRQSHSRGRSTPPTVVLDKAIAFKSHRGIDPLYLPAGTRLQPMLRRDVVRELLIPDDEAIVWLRPSADGRFTPETLPDDAFRPLEDWVDYVIDHNRETLRSWVQATQFDFDQFTCAEDNTKKPRGPGGGKEKKDQPEATPVVDPVAKDDKKNSGTGKKKLRGGVSNDAFTLVEEVIPNAELRAKKEMLEQEFLTAEGPLNSPQRQELWREIAEVSTALREPHHIADAALAWANVLWELDEVPEEVLWNWRTAEDPRASAEPTVEEFDTLLTAPSPGLDTKRRLVSLVLWSCRRRPFAAALRQRLKPVSEFLDHHDSTIPIRPAWLAWSLMASNGATDVLALARARDRLLDRLLRGLQGPLDQPAFMRTASRMYGERLRMVRDHADRLYRVAKEWGKGERVNPPYFDLLFAFAWAHFGEHDRARDLVAAAGQQLMPFVDEKGEPDWAHVYLYKAFNYRVEQRCLGEPHGGPLPEELRNQLEEFDRLATVEKPADLETLQRYAIDRFKEQSWVLEPDEKLDPYLMWKSSHLAHIQELQALSGIHDSKQLRDRFDRLLKKVATPAVEVQLIVLYQGLSIASRAGEDYSMGLVLRVPELLATTIDLPEGDLREVRRKMFERAMFLAGHYGREAVAKRLFDQFMEEMTTRSGSALTADINHFAREGFRTMRKVGLLDAVEPFLRRVEDRVIGGRSLSRLRTETKEGWLETLRCLLAQAEGWLSLGFVDRALPALKEARETLCGKERSTIRDPGYVKTARAYISAVGQLPVNQALDLLEDLVGNLKKVPNGQSARGYFSTYHFTIIEDVVRVLISDHMTMNDTARRHTDEDEMLVRRRIHADMRRYLQKMNT